MATAGTAGYGQALPPGWEAKYDPGQRRYFYINHTTQTTSWEDPRPGYYRQQQMRNVFQRPSPRPSPHATHVPLAVPHTQQPQLSPSLQPQRMVGVNPSPQRSPVLQPPRSPQPRHSPQPARSPHHARAPQPVQSPAAAAENIAMKDMSKSAWQKEVEDKYNLRVNTLQVEDEEEPTSNASSRAPSPHAASNRHESKKKRRPKSRETSFIQGYEEKIQKLRTMFPTADETIIKQFLIKNHNNEGATIGDLQQAGFQRQDATSVVLMANRIRRDFPQAETGIIRDILHGVSNNETKARQELKSLGYQQTTPASNSQSAGSLKTPRGISPQRSSSPHRPTGGSKKGNARSERAQTPKDVSLVEKTKLKKKMAAEFPDQAASIIEMALDVCHYDEGKVRTLIQSMATTQQAKQIVSRMGINIDGEEGTASPRRSSPAAAPSTSSTIFKFPETTPSTSSITPSTAFSSHFTSSSSFRSFDIGPNSSKSVTKQVTSSARTPRTRAVTSSQPAALRVTPKVTRDTGTYKSPNLTNANGPNPEMTNGPDRSILIEEYMANNGPDETLLSGADASLTSGPSTPVTGPNSEIRAGADPAFRSGPDLSLISGPMPRGKDDETVGVTRGGGVCNHFVTSFCWSMAGKWGSTSV